MARESVMAQCPIHGAKKADTLNAALNKSFCAQCAKEIQAAQAVVDRHVDPKACFINYGGSKAGWVKINGTGCAHWVAHQLGITRGSYRCHEKHTLRVPDLISGLSEVALNDLQIDDIWANAKLDHCGLVSNIEEMNGTKTITIKHCSSNQGKVAENDFATYFHSGGKFYRNTSVR
jgi:hypothetical protein